VTGSAEGAGRVAPATPAAATRLGRPVHVSRLSWYGGSAVVLALIAAMLVLSQWQYHRAQPHPDRALLAASRSAAAVPAADLLAGRTEVSAEMVGRRVVVSGRYLPGRQWLVPRPEGPGDGFLVVTAFSPDDKALPATVLVARGELTGQPAAAEPRGPAAPAGGARLTAWIAPPEALSDELATSMPAGQLPDLSPARLAGRLPTPLLDGYLGLVDPSPGLAPAPEPVPPSASTGWSVVNLGYSLQWLLFASAAGWMLVQQLRGARRLPIPSTNPPARQDG
jgi:cytochrome oxidase assembly protein ShyY1